MISTAASDNEYAVATRARKSAVAAEFYGQFSQLAKGRGGLPVLRTMFESLKALLVEYEHDFIAQLLFPEHYPPARYPVYFPIPTVVFETVDYGFVRPNNSGNMSIVVYPKRLGAWPSWLEATDVTALAIDGFVPNGIDTAQSIKYLARPVSPCVEIYNEENWTPDNWGSWHGAFPPDDIRLLYQSMRLTGCCFRLQYMSRLDEVSGYMATALDYKHNGDVGNNMTQIDYGLYKRVTHPLEGTRTVWFPKDIMDEEFEDYHSWVNAQGDWERWGTPARPPHEADAGFAITVATTTSAATLPIYWNSVPSMVLKYNRSDSVLKMGAITGPDPTKPSGFKATGRTLDGESKMDTDAMLMYATGLPTGVAGANQFRLELIRHWEAIPLQKFRQYLYGERPFTSQKGYDAMKSMGNMFPFFATATTQEAAGLKDVVQGRLGDLDAGQLNQAIAQGGSNDIITNVAQVLG